MHGADRLPLGRFKQTLPAKALVSAMSLAGPAAGEAEGFERLCDFSQHLEGQEEEPLTTEQENVQLIKELFAAFARGDVQSALALVAEDVDWQSPVTRTQSKEISWALPRHSREQVARFFQELAERVAPEPFEVSAVIAEGDRVVVEGHNRARVRSTGRSYEHDWVMVFTVRDGKIVRHRHYYDSADVAAAFHKQ